MTAPRLVRAAGCLVWRYGSKEPEILLVHRPRWRDWSFPKGKLERGEPAMVAAVREVEEETGLRVKLDIALPQQHYVVRAGIPKVVYYWSARPPADANVAAYHPNSEIDDVRWVRLSKARKDLEYEHDVDLLDTFASSAFDSSPLIIVRHSAARSRKRWAGDDGERPLTAAGASDARRLVPLLDAYGIKHVVSSDSARCVDTVLPYVNSRSVKLRLEPAISEDALREKQLRKVMKALLDSKKRVAICSHRPVLPLIFKALGLEPVHLETSELFVVHRRNGKIVDTEHHR